MKSIKEIAELCEMSKTSVNRAIEELQVNKVQKGNKYLIEDKDVDRIVLLLRGFALNCIDTETEPQQTETNQNNNAPNQNISTQTATKEEETKGNSTKNIDNSENNFNENMLNFLMEQIKEKDRQIASLQEDNKLLIQAQTYTLKQLEILTQPPQIESVEPEQEPERPKKKHWWNILR